MAISTQIQNLNLIPGKSAPVVVHLSQGNVGNTVQFYLYDGDNPYYPTNVSIAVHGVRADNTVFGPYAVSVTSGSNLVSFNIVSAMTSVNGAAIGELVLTDSGQNQIGTANFGMLIEATPYSSSVTYEDDLSIYQRILAYVQSIPADLQSQISEEATARQNAITAEASTRAAADTNLQTQINQIVAPTGEAPSAAEVENARIGADGVTYTTLGEAIRSQFNNIYTETEATYASGYIGSNGNVVSQGSSSTFKYGQLNVKYGDIIRYSGCASGYWTTIWGYDGSGTIIKIRESTASVDDLYFTVTDSRIKLVRAWSDESQKALSLTKLSIPGAIVETAEKIRKKMSRISVVSLDGNGDYTDLGIAVSEALNSYNARNEPYTIFVRDGVYNVSPKNNNSKAYCYGAYSKISIIGESRDKTIIRMINSGTLNNHILDVGGNVLVENLTLECYTDGTLTEANKMVPCYCIHLDRSATGGGGSAPTRQFYSTIRNCRLYNQCMSPIGAGLQDKQIIRLVDCEFVSDVATGLNSQGAIYIHSSADSSAGNMAVEIENCIAVSKDGSQAISLPNVDPSYGSLNYDEIPVTICRTIGTTNGESATDVSKSTHMLTEQCALNNIEALNN